MSTVISLLVLLAVVARLFVASFYFVAVFVSFLLSLLPSLFVCCWFVFYCWLYFLVGFCLKLLNFVSCCEIALKIRVVLTNLAAFASAAQR